MDENQQQRLFVAQPSFQATINLQKRKTSDTDELDATLDTLLLVAGTGHEELGEEISRLVGKKLANVSLSRFADSEVGVQYKDQVRGRNVFIIQPCATPVNDNILELLLTASAARRADANRVTAVIPYFGYKHHRRAMSTSTKHQSRFLSSNAMDFAKMLTEMGVDHVISIDLQRPGQGHEACFFDHSVPSEVIVTTELMIDYFMKNIKFNNNIVIVSPNAECVKKARKFQLAFRRAYNHDVKLATYLQSETGSGPTDVSTLQDKLGKVRIEGTDVVIVDDLIDTAETVTALSKRLRDEGARNVYVCASHGIFSEESMRRIEDSDVAKVFVTNSLPLNAGYRSPKVIQISVASLLARIILSHHFRTQLHDDDSLQMD
eukprot:CAMPEP_0182430804 /NCGR_PEP_ID=MMETSP1167-20130531/43649_1 /TAXON_ID=2988 /ORGANISM="Mallomonas Sp, Strain CCMP3275" /LENGTH=376 /DNA_ID=CAMNT_0024616317 /DNA_START=93 /DNA_END=1223 /DNA_ORIENTATION=+